MVVLGYQNSFCRLSNQHDVVRCYPRIFCLAASNSASVSTPDSCSCPSCFNCAISSEEKPLDGAAACGGGGAGCWSTGGAACCCASCCCCMSEICAFCWESICCCSADFVAL